MHGEDGEVADVAKEIESDDERGADAEGEGQVALRVMDFSGDEGDVMPGVCGEERAGLRHAESDHHADSGSGADGSDAGDVLRMPGGGEVEMQDRWIMEEGVSAEGEEKDYADELGDGEDVLDELAPAHSADVDEAGQEDDGKR